MTYIHKMKTMKMKNRKYSWKKKPKINKLNTAIEFKPVLHKAK